MSRLSIVSKQVVDTMSVDQPKKHFAATAGQVRLALAERTAAADREAEWQRVHSYIADVLKDSHVLYAKLARLEGDFLGEELTGLERISEAVLTIGEELSKFSKAFYEGKYDMATGEFAYGQENGSGDGGGSAPPPQSEESTQEPSLIEPEESDEAEGGDLAPELVEEQSQQQV